MTCHEFQTRLSAYMDGELSTWCRWKVQNHLRFCPECGVLMRELSAVDSAFLESARQASAPEYLTGSVMRRLPSMPPALPMRRGLVPWAAGIAVACVQVLALGGAYWWGFVHGTDHGGAAAGAATVAPWRIVGPGRKGSAAAPAVPVAAVRTPAAAPDLRSFHAGILAQRRYSGVDPAPYLEQFGPPRSLAGLRPAHLGINPDAVLNGAH